MFGVTLDPFIVYTSNLFAILSLRGLYSFVSTFMKELRYLDKAGARAGRGRGDACVCVCGAHALRLGQQSTAPRTCRCLGPHLYHVRVQPV